MAKGGIRCAVFEFHVTPADLQIGLLKYSAAIHREGDKSGKGVRLISNERNWPAAASKAKSLNAEKGRRCD